MVVAQLVPEFMQERTLPIIALHHFRKIEKYLPAPSPTHSASAQHCSATLAALKNLVAFTPGDTLGTVKVCLQN
jgi:hypothetical protein